MKKKFVIEVSFSAMNEFSLYERLRNAIFKWQTTEPKVRSVSVEPAPQDIKESGDTAHNKRMVAALAKAVWCHCQRRPFTWTLESIERVVRKCLNASK